MSKKDPDIGCVPSTFYYTFCATYVVVPVLSALMGIHAKPDKKFLEAEGPIVILGSHPSYLDPFAVMRLTKGRKVNFAAGEFLFRNKIWGKLFREAGIIPSKQFARDTTAVRAMFKVLDRGGVLTIFPEATRFIDGKSGKFDDGVARLIKKSGASLFFMDSRGAYLTYPRWSESFLRIGRIDAGKSRTAQIGENHFFGKSDSEASGALRKANRVKGSIVQHPGNVGILYDRTGNQLREAAHVKQQLGGVLLYHRFSSVNVHRIGEYLKGIKGDADGKFFLRHVKRRGKYSRK